MFILNCFIIAISFFLELVIAFVVVIAILYVLDFFRGEYKAYKCRLRYKKLKDLK